MQRRYDHIDMRVRSLPKVRPFYETLLPALGFTCDVRIEHWLQFEAANSEGDGIFWCHRVVAACRQRMPDRFLGRQSERSRPTG